MKNIKLILLIAGVCFVAISGFVYFANFLGYKFLIIEENSELEVIDESGSYQLTEMRSTDGKFVMYDVVQIKNDAGEKIEPIIVYTIREVPMDYEGSLAYGWIEGKKDFFTNSSLGYYRYIYSDGTWNVYERQKDFSFAPLNRP